MIGLNIEYPAIWFDSYEIAICDLCGCSWSDTMSTGLNALSLVSNLIATESAAAAEIDTAAFELIEPFVAVNLSDRYARAPKWLGRAREFLRQSFREPITLRDVAAETEVHPVYCARVFRRHLGCSVGEYIRRRRLVEAGRLIVEEGCTLAEAAMSAGFADQSHFTRACRRAFGFAPGAMGRVRRFCDADR
jgi:AraC family transcriptional regulator